MTSRPASAQHLVELVGMSPSAYRRQAARATAGKGQPDPYPGAALSRPAIAPEVERLGPIRHEEVLHDG